MSGKKFEEEYDMPPQIGEAAELAEELFKKMYPEGEAEDTETPTEDEESEETSDVDEDVEEEEEDDEPEIDPKELKKWRDRYLTLKGKYDAEVPRLASQVKELTEKITSPTKPKEEAPEENESDFERTYGSDFLAQMRKVINSVVQEQMAPVEEKVTLVEDAQQQAATESFKSYLTEKVENWETLWSGKDKGFVKFLEQKDPMGLSTYGEYLTAFNAKWDADGMANIFKIYNDSKTTKPGLAKEQEAMIAPSRTKTPSAPNSSEKKMWNTELMKEFETNDRLGMYSEEESQAIWADILASTKDGRFRA
jgi:hypothetical protein